MTLLRSVSRRHDQSYKLLFSIPLAVDQLIRHFLNADLAHQLDFERVEILATERIAAGLVRSHADLLWKIHFRGSPQYLHLQRPLPLDGPSGHLQPDPPDARVARPPPTKAVA